MGCREAAFEGHPKLRKGGIIPGIEALFTHKPPEPLNQVQVGGEGWQIEELDPEGHSVGLNDGICLIVRIIQHDRDRSVGNVRRQFGEQVTDGFGIHGGLVDDQNRSFVSASTAPSTLKRLRPDGVGMK